jgi:hypothetical protein
MKFNSGLEMYNYICKGNDLYSKSLGIYVFVYNDAGALCTYNLRAEELAEAVEKAKEHNEYWSAFLGWHGSAILDEYEYDDDEHRYSEDWELNKLYLKPSLDFCDETYMADDWADTKDVTVEYVMEE